MPPPQSSGIQTLLEAEKEASEIIARARKQKTQRLKEAKDEAEKEIQEFRAKKEEEFQAYLATNSGNTDEATKKLQLETDQKLKDVQQAYLLNKEAVIKKLLEAVAAIDPKPHINAKPFH